MFAKIYCVSLSTCDTSSVVCRLALVDSIGCIVGANGRLNSIHWVSEDDEDTGRTAANTISLFAMAGDTHGIAQSDSNDEGVDIDVLKSASNADDTIVVDGLKDLVTGTRRLGTITGTG